MGAVIVIVWRSPADSFPSTIRGPSLCFPERLGSDTDGMLTRISMLSVWSTSRGEFGLSSNVKCMPVEFFGGTGMSKDKFHGPSRRCSCAEYSRSGCRLDADADADDEDDGYVSVSSASVFAGAFGRIGRSGVDMWGCLSDMSSNDRTSRSTIFPSRAR